MYNHNLSFNLALLLVFWLPLVLEKLGSTSYNQARQSRHRGTRQFHGAPRRSCSEEVLQPLVATNNVYLVYFEKCCIGEKTTACTAVQTTGNRPHPSLQFFGRDFWFLTLFTFASLTWYIISYSFKAFSCNCSTCKNSDNLLSITTVVSSLKTRPFFLIYSFLSFQVAQVGAFTTIPISVPNSRLGH